jgi:hypothetical protein
VIELVGRKLVRIDQDASVERLKEAIVKDHDPQSAAVQFVSLIAQYGSVGKAPLPLLRAYLEPALRSIDAAGIPQSQFAMQMLSCMPLSLGVDFLPIITNAQSDEGYTENMVKYATEPKHRDMLHAAGLVHNVPLWRQHFLQSLNGEGISDTAQAKPEGPTKAANQPSAGTLPQEATKNDPADSVPQGDNLAGSVSTIAGTSEPICDEKRVYAREFIETLRRDRFGCVGNNSTDGLAQGTNEMKQMLDRALLRLAQDLYSTDTHFLLELLQNADDNSYCQSQVPEMKLTITEEAFECYNNELGFEEKHVAAICNVADSSKGSGGTGYIGQKGIGFKSVFRVSDKPTIHSNEWHFFFDAKESMIMPHWAEDENCDREGTRIVLPWKKGAGEFAAAYFEDVQPSLLLFLSKIRKISLIDEIDCSRRIIAREDFPDGIVQIVDDTHTGDAQESISTRWLKIERTFEVPLNVRRHPTQSTTAIALAFATGMSENEQRLRQYPVYAFLPLASYGFSFVVQADFEVPASREALTESSVFNQWAIQQIADVFVEAVDIVKAAPENPAFPSIGQLLDLIPLEGELRGVFEETGRQLRRRVENIPCIPTESGGFVLPCEALDGDSLVRGLISDEVLFSCTGLHWLQLGFKTNQRLLSVLGVKVMSAKLMLRILRTMHQKTLIVEVERIKWLAKALVC